MEPTLPGPGEPESIQSKRCGSYQPLTSAQENIMSSFLSVCPRFIPLVRNPDGIPTPSAVCGQTKTCVFWQITDILSLDRLFPMLFTHRVSVVQRSVTSQLARSV